MKESFDSLKLGLAVLKCILRHSKEDPVKAKSITELTGADRREIQYIVEIAVELGYPVCSGPFGYYQPKSDEERNEYLNREHDRAIAILAKTSAAKKSSFSQVSFFE